MPLDTRNYVYRDPSVLWNTHDDGVISFTRCDIYSLLDICISRVYMDSSNSEVHCISIQILRKWRGGALYKTRPLLNILKKTIGVFLIPVLEFSLGEASCASRSSYVRELLCFNPAKNCGKLHFRFYLLCHASNVTCLTIKIATRNDSDSADPEETFVSIHQEANYFMLNKLVLEMCRRYNNTLRRVNMYNYYTSPAVLIMLRNRGIYAIGTVKKKRRLVPAQIVLTKAAIK
jgi:hypothetical protein